MGNTSSYSYKTSKSAVGSVDGKSLVDQRFPLHTSTKNMALGSPKFLKSHFLAIITTPHFPSVLDFCGYGVLFVFGLCVSLALLDSLNCFSLSHCFLLRSSFIISSRVHGSKDMRSPLYMKTTLLKRPQS
jgi:hypothetical protein